MRSLRLLDGLARELVAVLVGVGASSTAIGAVAAQPPVPADHRRASGSSSSRHHMTSVMSPNVQIIAMPDPLLGVGEVVRAAPAPRTPNSGVSTSASNERLVALVVGMRDQRDARGDQLGPRRLDDDVAVAVDPREARACGTRRASRGPRARPARPRCGSRRPTAWAPRPGTPRRAPGCAGTRAATRAARPSPIVV